MSDEQLKDLAIKVWNATGFRTHLKPYDYNVEQIFKALKKVRDNDKTVQNRVAQQ